MSAAAHIDPLAITDRCQRDPEFFVREVLGDTPWKRQVEIFESIRDHRSTAVPSCHASGKSWTAGRAVLWFLYSFYGAKVITTAPTERQIRGILWAEIHRARRNSRAPLGGEPTLLSLKLAEDWYATGFTAPDWDPNRFQGYHAPHILVVVDEAAGISRALADQIDSLLSGGHARKLEIGNPVEAGTPFQASCESPHVHTLPISAFDTPNFTAFGIGQEEIASGAWEEKIGKAPLPHPDLITPQWVAERYQIWGPTSNAWKSRVLGQFPDTVEGAYYTEELKAARDQGRIGFEPHDPNAPVITAWDIGVRDATAIGFAQWKGEELRLIDYLEAEGQGLPYYAQELQRRPYTYCDHIAPPDMANREWGDGRSRVEIAASLGLQFRVLPRLLERQTGELAEGIDAVRRFFPRLRFDEDRCAPLLDALRNYRRKRNARTGELGDGPEHDWSSHGADMLRYLALGVREYRRVSRPRQNTRWVT